MSGKKKTEPSKSTTEALASSSEETGYPFNPY
jgi:hypothetical protein